MELPYASMVNEKDNSTNGLSGHVITIFSWILVGLTFPFSLFFCLKVVHEYERAIIFRLGRLESTSSGGIFFIMPCIDNFIKVDTRTFCIDVPPQEVLTRDSVTVTVDAVVYNRVFDATSSIVNVVNAHQSTRLLAQTTLRNVMGTKTMAEILGDRQGISNTIQDTLNDATEGLWGIKVERVEIKDVRLPLDLQRVMAAEAEALRGAKAKIIAAEGEHRAAKALKEASEIISQSPAALQLRYLQSLQSMCSDRPSTILFALPMDLGMTMENVSIKDLVVDL